MKRWEDFVKLCLARKMVAYTSWQQVSYIVGTDVSTIHQWALEDAVPDSACQKLESNKALLQEQ